MAVCCGVVGRVHKFSVPYQKNSYSGMHEIMICYMQISWEKKMGLYTFSKSKGSY